MSVSFSGEKLKKHKELSDKIKSTLKGEGAQIREEESHGAYLANLPEGITPDTITTVSNYNQNFVSAAHVAIAEVAGDMFLANKELNRIEAEVGFFGKHDSVGVNVKRSRTFENQMKPGEQIEKHLVMTTNVSSSLRGLKAVRNAISEEFADSFAK